MLLLLLYYNIYLVILSTFLVLNLDIHVECEKVTWQDNIMLNVTNEIPKDFPVWEILEVRQVELVFHNVFPKAKLIHSHNKLDMDFMEFYARTYKYGIHPNVNFEYAGVTAKDDFIDCPMTPQGIAATCDWALMVPCFYGNLSIAPKTVYVHHFMLGHFVNIMNYIPSDYRFVLVTSGTDHTIPTSKGDVRFQPLVGFNSNSDGGPNWKFLTEHRQIIHWFCENHDINHNKVSTLPTGIVQGIPGMEPVEYNPHPIPMKDRPLRFFVAHRLRTMQGQWELRKNVSISCLKMLLTDDLCLYPPRPSSIDSRKGISRKIFSDLTASVPFVVCVHGGGIDPSPKAWEAILLGTIPILQHSTLNDAYEQLPVVYVNDWNELFEGDIKAIRNRLTKILQILSPYYDDENKRKSIIEKLKTRFWVGLINDKYNGVYSKVEKLALNF